MESLSSTNIQGISGAITQGNLFSVVETPVIGKQGRQRVTTTCKSETDGQIISVLVEEFQNNKLITRQIQQFSSPVFCTKESFQTDGSLISSDTERTETDGRITKIFIRGSGKSSTTRIMSGEVEVRASERLVLIETTSASYSYFPFDGKWSSYYKDFSMKLELKSNFLKHPDSVLEGPDGLRLIFKSGRLVDLVLTRSIIPSTINSVPGIIE